MEDVPLDTILTARNGDQTASRALIEHLQRPVIAAIHRFLDNRFHGEFEDIAQEVFVKVFRAIDRFDPERGTKFTTWVYSFVRNHCFDILRKRRVVMRSLHGGEDGNEPIDVPDPSMRRPFADAENTELGAKIEEALAEIGEDRRMAFMLREHHGLDYASIAEVMDVSEGTVKSRLHRAKAALRTRLEPYMDAVAHEV